MSEFRFRLRSTVRPEWVRYREDTLPLEEPPLRAGVAGAYLPRVRLEVPHMPQLRVGESVPQCAAMILEYHFRRAGKEPPVWAGADWLAELLGGDERRGTPGKRLERLRPWGLKVDFPTDLQFFRDGTMDLDRRLGTGAHRLVFRWEERWLRYLTAALREELPALLFVDLSRLYPGWRGLRQPHAVVLSGGDGRQAWINDPSRQEGPVRIGLGTLMDALLPGEPLAAVLSLSRMPGAAPVEPQG